MNKRNIKRKFYIGWLLVVVLLSVCNISIVNAISQDDLHSIQGFTPFFDPNAQQCSTDTGSVTLTGSDNQQKAWNFFIGEGLSEAATAGIMGNIMQESSFNPLEVQGGGVSNDPAAAGSGGWGIVQWSPGAKVTTIAQAVGVSSSQASVDQLGTQLQIIWDEIQGKDPSEQPNISQGLKAITGSSPNAAEQAANFFVNNFEHGTDPGGIREYYAVQFLKKYAGSTGGSNPIANNSYGGDCASSNQTDANCTAAGGNVTGVAKIYCEAIQFNHKASYSETVDGDHMPGGNPQWIQQICPGAGKQPLDITPSCTVDCSGLVNISVYLAFGYNLNENTYGEVADTAHWQKIPQSQVQEGDLIQPAAEAGGHVEIVYKIQNGIVYTMGAHTSNAPQPQQVDTVSYPASAGDVYLHWKGPM